MTTQDYVSMSPRPDVEFDFILPHGMDNEDAVPSNEQTNYDYQNDHDPMEGFHHTTEPTNALDLYGQNIGEQNMNYELLPKGFSDDEDAGEPFDRSWSGRQAMKSPPKDKTSPKRSSDDGDDEASPTAKKPRKSLFGGPMEDYEEERPDGHPKDDVVDQNDDVREPKTPGHGIGNRLSSLNFEQQERADSPSERPYNLGLDIATIDDGSDRGSMSPTPPPDPNDEHVVIPPDDQVSALSKYVCASRAAAYFSNFSSLSTTFAQTSKEKKLSPMSTRTRRATSIRQKRQNKRL
jgi:hypothetical protein